MIFIIYHKIYHILPDIFTISDHYRTSHKVTSSFSKITAYHFWSKSSSEQQYCPTNGAWVEKSTKLFVFVDIDATDKRSETSFHVKTRFSQLPFSSNKSICWSYEFLYNRILLFDSNAWTSRLTKNYFSTSLTYAIFYKVRFQHCWRLSNVGFP